LENCVLQIVGYRFTLIVTVEHQIYLADTFIKVYCKAIN